MLKVKGVQKTKKCMSNRTGRSIERAEERVTVDRAAKSHWNPVAFWLYRTLPAEQNYTVGNQEMLAILMSCRHW